MLQFYYHPSRNPAKVSLFLEESGLPYQVVPIDTRKDEQNAAAFTDINPNAKTPALVDGDAVVFDSNAICCTCRQRQVGSCRRTRIPIARRCCHC